MSEQEHERHVAWARLALRLEQGHAVSRRDVADAMGVTDKTAKEWWARLAEVVPDAVERKVGRALVLVKPVSGDERDVSRRAVALGFAVDSLRALQGTPWHDELVGMRDAARANLDARAHVPDELAAGFAVVPGGRPARDQSEVLRDFTRAWDERRVCVIQYCKANGEERAIQAEPLGLLLRGDHVLAVVKERGKSKAALRRLRVDRMLSVKPLRTRFRRPAARTFDAARHLENAWGVTVIDGVEPRRVVVDIRGPWAVGLRHFLMHASQSIADTDREGWVRVSWWLAPCFELQAFLRGLGDDAVVIEPEGGIAGLVDSRLRGLP